MIIPALDLSSLFGINLTGPDLPKNVVSEIGEEEEAALRQIGHDSSSPQGQKVALTQADRLLFFVCVGKPMKCMGVRVKASAVADREEIEHGAQ